MYMYTCTYEWLVSLRHSSHGIYLLSSSCGGGDSIKENDTYNYTTHGIKSRLMEISLIRFRNCTNLCILSV